MKYNLSIKEKVRKLRKSGLGLNQISNISKVPKSTIRLWKKEYFDDHYHGVLRIHVRERLDHLLKMRGWIEGIKLNA